MKGLDAFGEGVVTVILAFVMLGIIATLVSPKARTGAVIQSGAGGVAEDILAAESPVTGNTISIQFPNSTGYPMTMG